MLSALLRNWELKTAAVVIATGVWLVVTSTEKGRVTLAAPVEYVGLDEDRLLVGDRREAVEVEVQGTRWMLTRLGSERVRVRVDLAAAGEGESLMQVSPDQVQVPPGLVVTRITPSRLRVTLADARHQTVRVTPAVRGAPAAGHTVARVTVEPSAVQIKGPRSTIEGRDTIETAPVDVTGMRESFTRTVGLAFADGVHPTRQRTVQVTVEILQEESMQRKKGPAR